MDIRQIMVYTDNCRELLRKTLAENPGVFDQPFESVSEYRSVRQLIAHLIGAEERLVETRLGRGTIAVPYEARAAATLADIFNDWDRIRARTHAFVNSCDAAGMGGMVPISLPKYGI